MPRNDDTFRKIISSHYERIREELEKGTLYGQPIDTTDMQQIVVAAFFYGELSESKKLTRSADLLSELSTIS